MRKVNAKVVMLTLLAVGFAMQIKAQKTNPEPIFGSTVMKKSSTDSTKKKSSIRLFHPVFLRLGAIGGVAIPFDNSTNQEIGGAMGLRVEYGLSNRVSLLGEVQANGSNGLTFPSAQTSLGVNLMPFKSKRLQPYVGVSFGVGGGGGNENNKSGIDGNKGGKDGNNETNGVETTDSTETNVNGDGFKAFGQMRIGLNYVVAKRLISTFETAYQIPFNNTTGSNGGLMLRIGLSYQFGKRKN